MKRPIHTEFVPIVLLVDGARYRANGRALRAEDDARGIVLEPHSVMHLTRALRRLAWHRVGKYIVI
jgi:hypothetical protein